eukprot:TRINITY_DN1153_c0_g1_i3.p1 TRINITY_DN1153_c0_g1~~TRINITY_DN1153_c0_g1_i3.p1  ORF type:complete len:320 (+),score=89.55 TRINITY_DN1153_c0_g1_i3:79-1038(+)
MPASVLVDGDDDEEDLGDRCGTETSGNSGLQSSGSRGMEKRFSTGMSITNSKSRAAQSLQVVAPSATAVGMAKKNAAFLSLNIQDFCCIAKEMGAGLLKLHSDYLSAAVEAVKQSKGLPDNFAGDRFYASFNAAKQTMQAKAAAGRCAQKLFTAVAAVVQPTGRAPNVSIAATAGEAQCGNMGVDGMKKYCMIGVPASFLHVAEQSNYRRKTNVLIDQKVKNDVENNLQLRLMVQVKYKREDRRLYQVMGEKQMAEDEWMYQLEEANKGDPGKVFNQAMESMFEGKYQEAHDALKGDTVTTLQHDIVLAELRTLLGTEW